jgi:uncharacterized phage-associated protein
MSANIKTLNLIHLLLSKQGVCDFKKVLKLMYFIDFEHYFLYEKPITGEVYYNLPHGPVPTRSYKSLFEEGQNQGLFKIVDPFHLAVCDNYKPHAENFEHLEQNTIENILTKYGHLSGNQLEALSHVDMPYILTELQEVIEYDYVKFRNSKISEIEDITNEVFNA